MSTLRDWWEQASPEQKKQLAKLAGTTIGTLKQIVGGYRTKGEVVVSPDLARKLEMASKYIKNMPLLWRYELSATCGACEFTKKCRKKKS